MDRPSRALVAAGRQLLHRTFSSNGDGPFIVHHKSEASAARRERLRNRLQALGGDKDTTMNLTNANGTGRSPRRDLSSAVEALDICRNVAKVLKESGMRLSLSGRWFSDQTSTVADEIHLETMAKHYTTLVEVRVKIDC